MRLLLAEDNQDLADWIARLLRQSRYTVDVVNRGDDADEALRQNDYALVILDLAMPGLDGFEVLKRLRQRKADTPVIILTANDAVYELLGFRKIKMRVNRSDSIMKSLKQSL